MSPKELIEIFNNVLIRMNLKSRSSAVTSVPSANADTLLLADNPQRNSAAIYNDSTAILYVLLSKGVASASNYSKQMPSQTYYDVPVTYTGEIRGFWAAANGSAKVTSMS